MFDQETLGQIQEGLRGVIHQEIQEQLQEIRGELKAVREDIAASEQRVIHTIVDVVGTMIDDNILPQFDELHQDISSIKQGRWQLA
jgi:hypothetical protein